MAEWINDPQGREEIEKVTKELKLPVWKANHKGKFRDFWNELWDKIEDYCIKLKEGTKKTDDRLNSAIGRNDGDFPIANAVVGDVYYSDVTKKYYKCKVGGPAPMPNGNFIDLSILENLNRLENLFSFNLIKTGQNKGYKFYTKASERTNYIDVSDTFLSVDFCIVSPYKEGISSNDARIVNFQEFKEGKILINSVWVKNGSIETKYSPNSSDSIITTSCIAFVYGTLKQK